MDKQQIINGLMSGMIGDAAGLPYEGCKRNYIRNNIKNINVIKFRMFFMYGVVSDDTEHSIFTLESLISSGDQLDIFGKELSFKLKFWFLTLPISIGFSTLKACLKLLFGFSYKNSGVNRTGNGSIMRTPVIANYYAEDKNKRDAFINVSTEITHKNLICKKTSLFLGDFIAFSSLNEKLPTVEQLEFFIKQNFGSDIPEEFSHMLTSIKNELTILEFCNLIKCFNAVPGYIVYTTTLAIFALYNFKDRNFEEAVNTIILCGGDTDTNAFLFSSMHGIIYGLNEKNNVLAEKIKDFPYNKNYINNIFNHKNPIKKFIYYPICFFRNILLTILVFIHIILRVLKSIIL